MKWNKKNIENVFAISIITVFLGQVYINPFSQWFRFSLAVVVLSLLLIYFKNISIVFVSTKIAILMFLFRAFVHYITFHEMTFVETLFQYLPVAIFYLVFGLLFYILDIRNKLNNPLRFILSLWVCDSIGNIAEGAFRRLSIDFPFDKAVLTIILIGLLRTLVTYSIYHLFLYYKNRYDREQKENKYREMILFIAKLKTELFFLRKSMYDIEDTMEKSYTLYEDLQENRLKEKALNISKNIHEIKKDYLRVVTGMEKTLTEDKKRNYMSIKDIFNIINDNTIKLIQSHRKDIVLKFVAIDNFYVKDHYPLVSILNNLIINSIESIESTGEVMIKVKLDDENYIFKVIDNGIGFEDDGIDLLFEPGYSTKFDPTSGKMSTGIGLSHVKQIVNDHYKGNIIALNTNKNTIFKITIPAKYIDIRM